MCGPSVAGYSFYPAVETVCKRVQRAEPSVARSAANMTNEGSPSFRDLPGDVMAREKYESSDELARSGGHPSVYAHGVVRSAGSDSYPGVAEVDRVSAELSSV